MIVTHWMAYRMKGFGGLVVPEPIAFDEKGRMWTPQGTHWGSRIESDGPIFEKMVECELACQKLNEARA